MAKEQRLIDVNKIKPMDFPSYEMDGLDVVRYLSTLPTADAVEVVRGWWSFGIANHREYMKCSVCLKSQTPNGCFTYCPNCGAKMNGGNEDG